MELNNKAAYKIIQDYITEAVKKEIYKNRIKQIIKEEYTKLKKDGTQTGDMKRKAVMNTLKDPKFNHAQLAYDLYHPKDQGEKDTVRSLFSKKATGKPDNDGAIRSFSDDEINKLYQMVRKR